MARTAFKDIVRRTAIVLAAFCLPYTALSASAQVNTQNETSPEPQEIRYLLCEYNGGLAVFRDDEPEPHELYSVAVNTLPEGDRIQLQNGIIVSGDEELRRLLEDYTS